jgi:hypothetical protein
MKYLKLFENFNQSEIDAICKQYKIQNYTINPNGSIDVDGNVYLPLRNLNKLPLKFNKVTGWFDCSDNQLTTLEGCPNYVGDNFNCSYNELTNLDGYPKEVGRGFYWDGNPISEIIYLFGYSIKIYLEYQETYNFVRKDCKIIKHLLEEALKDYNEYYNSQKELPKKIDGYTYI